MHQMVCHLGDSFRFVLGQFPVSAAITPFTRTIVKWLAFTLPWPGGVISTRPEIDQVRGGGTKPADFARDVSDLEALLERVTGPTVTLEGQSHPIFGPMSRAEWLRWGYLHMDHHLRQFGV